MIKIFECNDKNYLNKLTNFLDKRRNEKNNNKKKVSLILKDIKKNKIKSFIKYEKKFRLNKEITIDIKTLKGKILNKSLRFNN